MSMERARACLAARGLTDRILVFDASSATVELAAQAVGCPAQRIAKTLSFDVKGACVLIVVAGDGRIDNAKFKAQFGVKATMLPADQAEARIGHGVGGVCPFGVNEGVQVFLDASLQRFDTVYPACGSDHSAVALTPAELEACAPSLGWIDVCKGWM